MAEAIELARAARADGITTIAATPHVDWSHLHNDSAHIRAAVEALQARLDTAGVDVTIVPGGEVAATRALALGDEELRNLSLGDGRWLLLECPLSATLAPGFTGLARALADRGHRILLAHPERSPVFLRAPERLDELVAEGMLAQVTAGALAGRFGRTVRDMATGLVQRGSVQVVASDGHSQHRPARIAGELGATGIDPELIGWLAHDVPAALLAGELLPARPELQSRTPRARLLRLVGR
jgi:protein-tyrosine phosphatase